jgi:ABC-type amino acid transport system permease subunit
MDAGLSLGFSHRDVLRRIVLPQAFRTVIPPLGSITIAMIKNSAIVGASLLALPDLLKEARIVNSNTFQTTEAFFWAAVGYLLLTATATVIFRALEARYAIRR